MASQRDEDEEGVCGEAFDHDEVITYEDSEVLQWECRYCGAEGYEEKEATGR
jgi:hypothetical protein